MDRVLTVHDWWGGPVLGLAGYGAETCIYERVFSEERDEYLNEYHLTPVSEEARRDILADWAQWLAWMADGPTQERAAAWSRREGRLHLAEMARQSAAYRKYRVQGTFSGTYVNGYSPGYFVQWTPSPRHPVKR